MKTHVLLLATGLLSIASAAEGNRVATYLEYERAYFSNDTKRVSEWLAGEPQLTQTLHIPGVGPSSVEVTAKQLLKSMKGMKPRPAELLTPAENVTIEDGDPQRFCGIGGITKPTTVAGKQYNEREVRRFCFRAEGARYVLESQQIDVYYDQPDAT